MTILITGASGFLGRNLSKKIPDSKKLYFRNKIKDGIKCDLSNLNEVKKLFSNNDISGVVHCAANPNPKHPNSEDLKDFLDDHVLITTNLLECSKNIPFVYISSILIYGNSYPFESPSNLYGACKLSCEKICDVYAQLNNLYMKIIRPSAIVGPGLTHGLLFDIQRKLKSNSEYLELFGCSPGTIKPFIHVDDVIKEITHFLDSAIYITDITDCFPNDSASVEQIAKTVMDKLNIHKPIKWLGESTIWKGDNRIINTSSYKSPYQSSLEAIKNAI